MLAPILEFSQTIADRIPPFQYARGLNHWQVELDRSGAFSSIVSLTRVGKQGKLELGNPDLPASPHRNRTSEVAPKLIVDRAEYIFGLAGENEKQSARAARYHQAYLSLLERCQAVTGEPDVQAIAEFLSREPLVKIQTYLKLYPTKWTLEPGHVIRFLVDGIDPTQLTNVQQFWAEYCSSENLPQQPCLVTGKVQPIATKLEYKLKSIPNTQASGASLISAHCDSFHSYGQAGAEVSPIGSATAEALGQTLSYLESTPKHRLYIGPVVYLYWSIGSHEFELNRWFSEPLLENVRLLVDAVNTGNLFLNNDTTKFYVLVLAGGGGRAIVRDFLQTTVSDVKVALAEWFSAQQLRDLNGEIRPPIGLYALAAQAYRDVERELQSRTLGAMSRSALTSYPLPRELLLKVLSRVRVCRGPNYRQASLIKLILNYLAVKMTVDLDKRMKDLTNSQRTAYCCGRLLATFAAIQYYALGQTNFSTGVQAYGNASTAPSKVFGQLEAKAQMYLSKLRKHKPKIATILSQQLEEIHAAMPGANPNTLTLEEQGIFAMGYWQQRAYRTTNTVVTDERPVTEKLITENE